MCRSKERKMVRFVPLLAKVGGDYPIPRSARGPRKCRVSKVHCLLFFKKNDREKGAGDWLSRILGLQYIKKALDPHTMRAFCCAGPWVSLLLSRKEILLSKCSLGGLVGTPLSLCMYRGKLPFILTGTVRYRAEGPVSSKSD